jgi:hypothetical protein
MEATCSTDRSLATTAPAGLKTFKNSGTCHPIGSLKMDLGLPKVYAWKAGRFGCMKDEMAIRKRSVLAGTVGI